jgi:hypothetical protein
MAKASWLIVIFDPAGEVWNKPEPIFGVCPTSWVAD